MSELIEKLERLFSEKILLYQDMAECLKHEQKSLMETDVDSLWKFSGKKQDLAGKIETLREGILETLEAFSIDHGMERPSFSVTRVMALLPDKSLGKLRKLEVALINMKNTVQALAKQNKAFVVEYLEVIDDLAKTIACAQEVDAGYDHHSRHPEAKSKMNLFLHREA